MTMTIAIITAVTVLTVYIVTALFWPRRVGFECCVRHGWVFTRGRGVCPICRGYGHRSRMVE